MASYKKFRVLLKKFVQEFSKKDFKESIFHSNFLKNKKKYYGQCIEIISGQRNVFILDLEDLSQIYDSGIKELVFFNTLRFLEILSSTLILFFNDYIYNSNENSKYIFNTKVCHIIRENLNKNKVFNLHNFEITLVPPKKFPIEKLNSINASMIGKFILIEGICNEFKSKIIKLKFATYFCRFCGARISSKIKEYAFKPIIYCFSKKCEKKYNRKLFLDNCLSNFQTYRIIKIFDKINKNEWENPVAELEIYIDEKFYQPVSRGSNIRCGGVLLPNTYERVAPLNNGPNFCFKAIFFEKQNYNFRNDTKFLIKQKHIFELFRSPNLYDRITDCLLPSFLGNADLKKSLTLSITSTESFLKKSTIGIRKQIHVLMIGDFNIGKSSLLKLLSSVSPNATYVNYLNSPLKSKLESDSDENFIKIKNQKSKFIDDGIIFIDNFFFLKESHFFFLDEILETQTLKTYTESPKITIVASITTSERLEINKAKKKRSQFEIDFFHKFDLVFFQDQQQTEEFNQKVSEYLLENYGKEKNLNKKENFIDKDILKAFFRESEHIHPKFSKKSIEMVVYNYILLRANVIENFNKELNLKILISIIRLSIALAKLNFKDLVSTNDTKEALRLINSSFLSIKNIKLFRKKIFENSIENKIYNLIRKISLQKANSILDLPYLAKISLSMGFSKENFAKCLEIYENLNIWAISLKQMKLVFLI